MEIAKGTFPLEQAQLDFATGRHFGPEYIETKVTEYQQKAEHCRKTAAAYRAKVAKL